MLERRIKGELILIQAKRLRIGLTIHIYLTVSLFGLVFKQTTTLISVVQCWPILWIPCHTWFDCVANWVQAQMAMIAWQARKLKDSPSGWILAPLRSTRNPVEKASYEISCYTHLSTRPSNYHCCCWTTSSHLSCSRDTSSYTPSYHSYS